MWYHYFTCDMLHPASPKNCSKFSYAPWPDLWHSKCDKIVNWGFKHIWEQCSKVQRSCCTWGQVFKSTKVMLHLRASTKFRLAMQQQRYMSATLLFWLKPYMYILYFVCGKDGLCTNTASWPLYFWTLLLKLQLHLCTFEHCSEKDETWPLYIWTLLSDATWPLYSKKLLTILSCLECHTDPFPCPEVASGHEITCKPALMLPHHDSHLYTWISHQITIQNQFYNLWWPVVPNKS